MGGDYQAKSRHSGNKLRRRSSAAYPFELTRMHGSERRCIPSDNNTTWIVNPHILYDTRLRVGAWAPKGGGSEYIERMEYRDYE